MDQREDHDFENSMEEQLDNLQADQVKKVQKRIRIITGVVLLLLLIFLIHGYWNGWFSSPEPLEQLFRRLGPTGFIVSSLLVIFNCIFPIMPASIPQLAMFMAYGPLKGFISVFILNIIGSSITFLLADRFGEKFVKAFVPDAVFDKIYSKIENEKTASKILILAYLVPGIPDDATTMVVGMTNMRFSRFLVISLVFRPLPIFIYLYGFSSILRWIFQGLLGL